jgi:hypothetical protein
MDAFQALQAQAAEEQGKMKTVKMSDFEVAEPDDLESDGFGPCIGVAFVTKAGGTLMH